MYRTACKKHLSAAIVLTVAVGVAHQGLLLRVAYAVPRRVWPIVVGILAYSALLPYALELGIDSASTPKWRGWLHNGIREWELHAPETTALRVASPLEHRHLPSQTVLTRMLKSAAERSFDSRKLGRHRCRAPHQKTKQ